MREEASRERKESGFETGSRVAQLELWNSSQERYRNAPQIRQNSGRHFNNCKYLNIHLKNLSISLAVSLVAIAWFDVFFIVNIQRQTDKRDEYLRCQFKRRKFVMWVIRNSIFEFAYRFYGPCPPDNHRTSFSGLFFIKNLQCGICIQYSYAERWLEVKWVQISFDCASILH